MILGLLPPGWAWLALSALLGGILTAILLPIVIYFFVRIYNNRRLEVKPGTLLQGLEKKHWNLPLILTNKSYSSIKNVIVYLKIGFSKEDLREDPNITVIIGMWMVIKLEVQKPK